MAAGRATAHPIHYPGAPSQPIYHPGHPDHGYVPHPDQGLPGQGQGGQGGSPSHPIYHPGHPDHGLPAYPDQGLPGGGSGSSGGQPSHPIHLPGVPDQGLPEPEPVPPEGITDPELPEGYDDELVIAVKKAGGDDWDYYAYSVQPDQGQPTPMPQSAGRRGR